MEKKQEEMSYEEKYKKMCDVLNVGLNASKAIIGRCYRQQCASCHEDRFVEADPETRRLKQKQYLALKEAYEFIETYRRQKGTWEK